MAFVKVVKNKAYFKRFQVKYRRRREGKTDYFSRRRLVLQDKNKYNARKHRLVVRLSNRQIVCQIVYSTIKGDCVMAAASSEELPNYGVKLGLTNYAAAYCTGLLVARRVLKKLGLDTDFAGSDNINGDVYLVDACMDDEGEIARRPFKCFLDVGIVRTTVGNRVFGAMKGACDGGIYIPHSPKRFPGYDAEAEGDNYDPEVHRCRIFGIHVANYMKLLQEDNPDKYDMQFAKFISNGIKADDLEPMYKKAHQMIRSNPDKVKVERKHAPVCKRDGQAVKTFKGSYIRNARLSCDERKDRVRRKLAIAFDKKDDA